MRLLCIRNIQNLIRYGQVHPESAVATARQHFQAHLPKICPRNSGIVGSPGTSRQSSDIQPSFRERGCLCAQEDNGSELLWLVCVMLQQMWFSWTTPSPLWTLVFSATSFRCSFSQTYLPDESLSDSVSESVRSRFVFKRKVGSSSDAIFIVRCAWVDTCL